MKSFFLLQRDAKIKTKVNKIIVFSFSIVHKIKIAKKTVTGRTKIMLWEVFKTDAIAMAPNAVCESPSPIYESLLRTKVTPSNEETMAIIMPAINAYCTNENEKYIFMVSRNSLILQSPPIPDFLQALIFLFHIFLQLLYRGLW